LPYSPGWPGTHGPPECLNLPSAVITGVYHHGQIPSVLQSSIFHENGPVQPTKRYCQPELADGTKTGFNFLANGPTLAKMAAVQNVVWTACERGVCVRC
jgi:hypothetical protein